MAFCQTYQEKVFFLISVNFVNLFAYMIFIIFKLMLWSDVFLTVMFSSIYQTVALLHNSQPDKISHLIKLLSLIFSIHIKCNYLLNATINKSQWAPPK